MPELEGGWWNKSFKVQDTPENKELLKELEDLARKDGWSFSQLVREALLEYAKRHAPGNPQLALAHWTEDTPMPLTVQEKRQSELSLQMELQKRKGEERFAKLNGLTNEELLSRHSKLQDREGSYMERMEISMILMHRRMANQPIAEQMP